MGTWLYHKGVTIGQCAEELNISRPEIIQAVHREYYDAGARLIETNTFGANRDALSRFGLKARFIASTGRPPFWLEKQQARTPLWQAA